MADNDVKLKITTEADTKGAKEAEKAIDAVGKQAVETTQATKKIGENTASLSGLRRKVQELKEELERAEIGTEQYDRALDELASTSVKLSAATDKTAAALRDKEKAHGAAAKATGNSGMATLEFSRALEDAQYGIGGVLNNLPGLIANLGGSAGLAGVVSIAAVGITFLVKQLISLGETAEEKTKRMDQIAENAKTLDDAIKKFVNESYDQLVIKEQTAAEKTKISHQGIIDSIGRKITAMDKEIAAVEKVREAVRKRMEMEIELRRVTDPKFDEVDAVAQRAQMQAQALEEQRDLDAVKRKNRLLEIEVIEYDARIRFKQLQDDLAKIAVQKEQAEMELSALASRALPTSLRDPKAQQANEAQIKELNNPFRLPIEHPLRKSDKVLYDKALADRQAIQQWESDPALQAKIELLEKTVEETRKQIPELTAAVDSGYSTLGKALEYTKDQTEALAKEAETTATEFKEKADALDIQGTKDILKASVDDIGKEVGDLRQALEESGAPEKAAELKGITEEIASATRDGAVTVDELKKVQEQWRELAPKLAGLGPEVAAQLVELKAAIDTTQAALKEALTELNKTTKTTGDATLQSIKNVTTTQQNMANELTKQNALNEAIFRQINILNSK